MSRARIFIASLAAAILTIVPIIIAAPSAQAASCSLKINNGLVNPTATAKCNTGTYYRVKAYCWPGIVAYGDWVRNNAPSVARCLFVNVTSASIQYSGGNGGGGGGGW